MTIFTFNQLSASIPGLTVDAAIDVNGNFSNLPNISSYQRSTDFGNLNGLTFTTNAFNFPPTFTLANFTLNPDGIYTDCPCWIVNPNEINIIAGPHFDEQFDLTGLSTSLTTIHVNWQVFPTGAAYVTGTWTDPVPEPTSLVLVATLLAVLIIIKVWGKRTLTLS